jgi:hypothetical protein
MLNYKIACTLHTLYCNNSNNLIAHPNAQVCKIVVYSDSHKKKIFVIFSYLYIGVGIFWLYGHPYIHSG